MTNAETTLNAGRELDALIAERVMGVVVIWDRDETFGDSPMLVIDGMTDWAVEYEVPHYSTDIAAAWHVVERMAKLLEDADEAGITFPWEGCNYLALQQLGAHAGWAATFCCIIDDDEWFEHPEKFGGVKAESAPLAICLAALKALQSTGMISNPPKSIGSTHAAPKRATSTESWTMETPKSIVEHQSKYNNDAWKQYSLQELGNFVHLLVKRATHRAEPEKRAKDIDDAQNYLAMMQAHLDALRNA